ncbi:MAG: universal stress protein, partial [Armatimonadetes bacterium]|nr:universal stress protein [Armatimonadota bacterium]
YKKILHGQDGSEGAFNALVTAIDLAKRYCAELHMICVEEVPHYAGTVGEVIEEKDRENSFFQEAIQRSRKMAAEQGVDVHVHVVAGHEVKTIIEFIKENAIDLLVIGFMGHSALYERVMGSTCQSLVRLASCSVLVVK